MLVKAPNSNVLIDLPGHYHPRHNSAIWNRLPDSWHEELVRVCAAVAENGHVPRVFFRDDDIGAGGRAFEKLCQLFRHYEAPLALAVVPAWLSPKRIDHLFRTASLDELLWGWHQHGWRHVNWQRKGKKCEFGEHRPFEKQWRDLWQGQQKMLAIFGHRLVPVFTPPWNRLSLATLKILQELGFQGVSLDAPLPKGLKCPVALKNLRVHIDLHTRKAKDGGSDYSELLNELRGALLRKEPCGVMVHHQRMTLAAFDFLNELLQLLKNRLQARFLSFHDLLSDGI